MDSRFLHDNRDTTILGNEELMSQIRGHRFPVQKEELDLWIKCRTLIPVVLEASLSTLTKGHHHGPPAYDLELLELLKHKEITKETALNIKFLIEIFNSKTNRIDHKNVEVLFSQSSEIWARLSSEMKEKSFTLSYDWCEKMTLLIEVTLF